MNDEAGAEKAPDNVVVDVAPIQLPNGQLRFLRRDGQWWRVEGLTTNDPKFAQKMLDILRTGQFPKPSDG